MLGRRQEPPLGPAVLCGPQSQRGTPEPLLPLGACAPCGRSGMPALYGHNTSMLRYACADQHVYCLGMPALLYGHKHRDQVAKAGALLQLQPSYEQQTRLCTRLELAQGNCAVVVRDCSSSGWISISSHTETLLETAQLRNRRYTQLRAAYRGRKRLGAHSTRVHRHVRCRKVRIEADTKLQPVVSVRGVPCATALASRARQLKEAPAEQSTAGVDTSARCTFSESTFWGSTMLPRKTCGKYSK